jgi:hypothetical protein
MDEFHGTGPSCRPYAAAALRSYGLRPVRGRRPGLAYRRGSQRRPPRRHARRHGGSTCGRRGTRVRSSAQQRSSPPPSPAPLYIHECARIRGSLPGAFRCHLRCHVNPPRSRSCLPASGWLGSVVWRARSSAVAHASASSTRGSEWPPRGSARDRRPGETAARGREGGREGTRV